MKQTNVHEHKIDSAAVLDILFDHLPRSIAIYRRIKAWEGDGQSHVYANWTPNQSCKACLVIAFVNRSLRPETELYPLVAYDARPDHRDCETCRQSIVAVLDKAAQLSVEPPQHSTVHASRYMAHVPSPSLILAGAVDEYVANIIHKLDILNASLPSMDIPYAKYIFHRSNLPDKFSLLPSGFSWMKLTEQAHLELVISRSRIPRQMKTMATLVSVAVREEKTQQPIAWGFISADGSMSTLHVEEPWRGRGIAKVVACRIITESLGVDGYSHADVGLENVASRHVCESIGGKDEYRVYWLRIDLDKVIQLVACP